MKKLGTYKIIAKERLIVEYHSGKINVDEFIESRRRMSTAQEYNPDFDLVLDFRDVAMIVSNKDISRFIDFFRGYHQIIGKRKSAYLTSKPNEVVITTLFSVRIKDSPIRPMTFSTVAAAAEWLNKNNIDKNILAGIINELKTLPDMLYSV